MLRFRHPSVRLAKSGTQRLLTRATPARQVHYGSTHGDSEQACKALRLFLSKASLAAAQELDSLLEPRGRPPLDAILRAALREDDRAVPTSAFRDEWVAFAKGAQRKRRTSESGKAWAQFGAFGGTDAAPALGLTATDDCGASAVTREGVARLRAVLSAGTAAELRAFVLSERDAGEARA